MKVIREDGQIKVQSEYNKAWITRAKQIGGKWNAPHWCFRESDEDLVRESLMKIYGEDGTPCKMVTVDVTITEDDTYTQEIIIAGKAVARRVSRDSEVKMANGAVLVRGGFPKSGGSCANPRINGCDADTVIRVTIPEKKLAEVQSNYTVALYEAPEIDRAALEEEKQKLLERLAEIEKLLA